MEKISGLLFWIPVVLFFSIALFFVRWSKDRITLAGLSLVVFFFIYQVLNHRHFDSPWLLFLRLLGLFFSMIFLIIFLKKQSR
ncbi:hypothetical protein BAU14_04945 [Enterococcus sp. CU9D]|nr:hypothetical protein BAU14_04945 [Enterococcus sp. CU9D]